MYLKTCELTFSLFLINLDSTWTLQLTLIIYVVFNFLNLILICYIFQSSTEQWKCKKMYLQYIRITRSIERDCFCCELIQANFIIDVIIVN